MALPHLVVAVCSAQCPVVFSKSTLDNLPFARFCGPYVTSQFLSGVRKVAVIMVLRVLMPPGPLIYVILASRRDAVTNSREHKAASRRRDNDIVSDHSASKNAIKNLNWGTYIGESILVSYVSPSAYGCH